MYDLGVAISLASPKKNQKVFLTLQMHYIIRLVAVARIATLGQGWAYVPDETPKTGICLQDFWAAGSAIEVTCAPDVVGQERLISLQRKFLNLSNMCT
jgi:hypothetical protein